MTNSHQVVVFGFPELTTAETITRLVQVFGISHKQAGSFISDQAIVVKRGLSPSDALAFAKVLQKIGAKTEILPPIESKTPLKKKKQEFFDLLAPPIIPKTARSSERTSSENNTELDFSSHSSFHGVSSHEPPLAKQINNKPSTKPGEVQCQHCSLVQKWRPGCHECGATLGQKPDNYDDYVEVKKTEVIPKSRAFRPTLFIIIPVSILILFVYFFLQNRIPGSIKEKITFLQVESLPAFFPSGFEEHSSIDGTSFAIFDVTITPFTCLGFIAHAECDLDAELLIDGNVATFDQMANGTPIVTWCSHQEQNAQVKLWPFDEQNCRFDMIGYMRPMVGRNDRTSLIQVNAERFLVDPRPVGAAINTMFDHQTTNDELVRIRAAGCYAIVGQSAPNTDLDLSIELNETVYEDIFLDNFPIIEFCVEEPQILHFDLTMHSGVGPASYWLYVIEQPSNKKAADPGYGLRAQRE